LKQIFWIMSTKVVFEGIADLLQGTFQMFEVIGNSFNLAVIALGFFGLFYWLRLQAKFNAEAAKNPNQLK
jgi:succinate-acetate transporter protein